MLRSFARVATVKTPSSAGACHPRRAETGRLSKAECLEMIFASASLGIGECPGWLTLALEASKAANAERIDVDDGGEPR